MTRFHSRRLFGKVHNRVTEVISVCGKDVIFVSNKQAKAYFIRSNTGWIVMCGGSSADENEQFVHLAETTLEENISQHVKGVIFSRPLAGEKEYIPEAWKHNQEELTVYLPSSSEDFLEEDAIVGVALYHVKHSGSVLIDGLEVELLVDAEGQSGLGFYLPRYQVFQSGEKYDKSVSRKEDTSVQSGFRAEFLLEEWKREVENDAAAKEERTFLLEIRDREEMVHFAVKLQKHSFEYVEVEEELADYFWDVELPIVQISKEKLGRVFAQKDKKRNWYDSLVQALRVA